jgi:hypothetical protein
MKFEVEKKITIKTTMDSSELVMFNKGGSHKINLKLKDLFPDYDGCDQMVEIQVQLEKTQQSMFNATYGQAQQHIQNRVDQTHCKTHQEKCYGQNFNIK